MYVKNTSKKGIKRKKAINYLSVDCRTTYHKTVNVIVKRQRFQTHKKADASVITARVFMFITVVG